MLRLAGVLCLLRESVDGLSQFTFSVKAIDVQRAIKIVENSNAISFHIVNRNNRNIYANPPRVKKEPVPEAKDMTIEFLLPYRALVARILAEEFRELSWITKNKCYPIIENAKSAEIGIKFINGLVEIGLGKHETRGNKKVFRRCNPEEHDCPRRDQVIEYWKKLEIEIANSSV